MNDVVAKRAGLVAPLNFVKSFDQDSEGAEGVNSFVYKVANVVIRV